MTSHSKISVKTHPNGYELTVGKEGFFYHNIEDLLAGFIVRIGCQCQSPMDVEDLHHIVLSLASKPDVKTLLVDGRANTESNKAKSKSVEYHREANRRSYKKKTRNGLPDIEPSHHTCVDVKMAERLRLPLRNIPIGKRIKTILINAISAYRGQPVDFDTLTLADVARLMREDVVNAKGCGGATYYELVRLMEIYHIKFGMNVDKIMERV